MRRALVRRVVAWAPGLACEAAWRACAAGGQLPAAQSGAPEARFLHPLVRRRCDDLTRALLHVANEAAPAEALAACACVFASRHASLSALVELLDALADARALSPNTFSHSVHNAPAGVFSVWAGNRNACSSIAGGPESFVCGLLEALSLLAREPQRDVLLACGDEFALAPLTPFARPLAATHAVAVMLGASGEGTPLELSLDAEGSGVDVPAELPDELAFARWWHAEQPALELLHGNRRWRLERKLS